MLRALLWTTLSLFSVGSSFGQINLSFNVTEPICFGLPNGSVTASASGGTPTYTYQWNTGASGATLSGIPAGSYSVTVTDGIGNTASQTVNVGQPALVAVDLAADELCNAPFTITATPSGGVGSYQYNWTTGATTPVITNVPAGQYCVTVTDGNFCGAVECITVDADPPSVSVSATNVTCPGGANGSVTAFPAGGQPPYTYAWSNGGSTQTITGLPAGSYTVTLTDANGCTASATGFVSQPPPINITINSTNPTCLDDTNGGVSAFVTGGNPPYQFMWSNGATGPFINNLGPGTYILTVTDDLGCVATASVTLQPISSLVVNATSNPETCPDFNDGFATANVSGGVQPLSYLWNTGATTQVIGNLAPGTYSVTVTDGAGCTATDGATVVAAPDFSVAVNTTNATLCDVNNGTATAVILQGIGPFSYLWNTGATTQTITGLPAGNYSVTVTNGDGCQDSASGAITAPPPLFADASATPFLCPGDNSGTASVSVTGGTPPFNYSWSTGANTQTITGLSAGTYSVTVSDNFGCSDTDVVTITQAPGVNITVTGTTTVCGAGNTGSASVTVNSGTPPFNYSWSNGATTPTISNLAEGTYSVTVTDGNNCTATGSITINVIDDLAVAVNGTDVPCFGEETGTATATPSGGNGPYGYSWSNGATTQTIAGLTAGIYSVVVTDANGCTTSGTVIIDQPPLLSVTINPDDAFVCFGEADGSLTALPAGGTPAYSYNWSNGATTQTITGLAAGTYTVTVTDANGCTAQAGFTITENLQINLNIEAEQVVCGAEDSGEAEAQVTGGTPPYQFLWNTGDVSESISNLPSGTYTVTVTDAQGCTAEADVNITVISDFGVNLIPRDVLCFGGATGSVLAQASGGDTPYTFNWSNGGTTEEIVGLSMGNYSVTITDANGCAISETVTINQPTQVTAAASGLDPDCADADTGSATVTAAGGTPPYQYEWSDGGITPTITGLTAGTYTVTVTDANLCTATAQVTLTDPPALEVQANAPIIVCGGTGTGVITAIVTGGAGPYTYLWSDGQTTMSATNLLAGSYSVTVTDANGCSNVASNIVLAEIPAVDVTLGTTNIVCTDQAVGSVTATPSAGTPPYTYAWSNGANTPTISNLSAGTYTVTVTDSNNCTAVESATITQTPGLAVEATSTSVTCFGDSDGSAAAMVTGGTPDFTYNWSNGGATQTITGLAAGTYTVTVTDANGCEGTGTVVVDEPPQLTATAAGTDIDCGGTNTGTATVTAGGGTPTYGYLWSNGQTTATATGLAAGSYTVTVTDANGCTAQASVTITSPNNLTVTITQNSGTCTGENDGILVANAMGGSGAYSYSWSNGGTTQTISNLAAGTYSVTVTDTNGCTAEATAGLTIFPSPSCSVTVDQESTEGDNGQLTVTAAGGAGPYTYNWSNGATTPTITDLAAGTYTVTVTDGNGCSTTCSATLEALSGIGNYVWEDIDHDGLQDDFEPPVPGVTVNLKNAAGVIIATTTTDANGEYYFVGLAPGDYSIQFEIPMGFDYTANDTGDDALDSDIQPGMNGMTHVTTLDPGEFDNTVDGGIYVPPNGVIADPCTCLNNATNEFNGQFYEEFTVHSYPNETWTVIDGSGMYALDSPEPPAAPLPVTFPSPMEETEPGTYIFPFKLVDEITYTVVVTNGFDTLEVTNVCTYPTLNISDLPPLVFCRADDPIQLDADPSVPGNLIFLLNGVPTTEIDPFTLDVGDYELVAELVPFDPEECTATITRSFSITEDCFSTIGDFVWLDLDCDGTQDGNEPGVPNVMVLLSGVSEFEPNYFDTTFTDVNGNYYFYEVPPGTYKLTFPDIPPSYDLTAPNQGGNDQLDSDVFPSTLMTDLFTIGIEETNYSFDLGLCPECINITNPGAIGYNQYLCAPGNDPDPLVSIAPPSGGSGTIEYMWMMITDNPNTNINLWTPIPNSNSPTYNPGPLFQTTYYARCARIEECGPWLETNIVVIEVGDEVSANILPPSVVCYNELATFEAVGLEPGSNVLWNFGPAATPSTSTQPVANVVFSSFGTYNVSLAVTIDDCTAYDIHRTVVTNNPAVCNQSLAIDVDIVDEAAGQVVVSWEMPSYVQGLSYQVEHSADGTNFAPAGMVTAPAVTLNGINYFESPQVAPKMGRNFYRVKLMDQHDNFTYSDEEEVILSTDSELAMLYPNPVDDVLTLELFDTFGEEITVELSAVNGARLEQIQVAEGSQMVQLDLSSYPAGTYYLRLRYGRTDVKTMRVVKR